MTASTTFVSPAWLSEHIDDERVIAVDGSFFLPDEGKDAETEFRTAHIPGAVRFDVDAIADSKSSLPHMLPDTETFAEKVGALGIGDGMTIVIYDSTDLIGGARVWWMFNHYGAKDVHLLEGGLKAWVGSGYAVETGASGRQPRSFTARFDDASVQTAQAVLTALQSGSAQIVDARSAARYEGSVPEPRPGLRSGHIPSARNVPWRAVVDADGKLKSADSLAETFRTAGVDIDRPIITSCGSGVSAAILILALERLGKSDIGLYDGSWSEWGADPKLPIETGPARP